MTTLRLSIPNCVSFRRRILNGLLAVLFVVAVLLMGVMVVRHQAFFRPHYFLWSMAGLLFVGVCAGFALIFADEALLTEKGCLFLSENGFEIGEESFSLGMLRKVSVVVQANQGQAGGSAYVAGNGNRIVFVTASRQKIALYFSLQSKEELEVLQKLLRIWQARGIRLKVEGMVLD